MSLKGLTGQAYDLEAKPFSSGGEGDIYRLVNMAGKVAKIYHADRLSADLESKLKAMVKRPPSSSVLSQVAWPLDVLYDANRSFRGFVMPKLEISEDLIELYRYPPQKYKNVTMKQKLILAQNICAVISEVHRAGYVFGDFNPRNIGVNLNNGTVAFLDTDSYHIPDKESGRTYRCEVCLDGYVAPELLKACEPYKTDAYATAPLPTFTVETDNFALAIHVFKLLMNGYTPYNGIKETDSPSVASPGIGNHAVKQDNYCFKPGNKPLTVAVPPLDILPQEIADLFTAAFMYGRLDPKLRPSAIVWHKALAAYEASLTTCGKNRSHQYRSGLKGCPWCEADEQYARSIMPTIQQKTFAAPVHPVISPPPSVPAVATGAVAGANPPYQGATGSSQSSSPYAQPVPVSRKGGKAKWVLISGVTLTLFIILANSIGGIGRNTGTTTTRLTTRATTTSATTSRASGTTVNSGNLAGAGATSSIQASSTQSQGMTIAGNSFSGKISTKSQVDRYVYKAPLTGRYRFSFDSSNVDSRFNFSMTNAAGTSIGSASSSSSGETVDLVGGQSYQIKIEQSSGLLDYTVAIGIPQDVQQISGTAFSGKLGYTDQVDRYTYVAPISGRYRFDFDSSNVQNHFYFSMSDSKNNSLADTNSSNTGKTVDLEAGQSYSILIRQSSGYLSYTVKIGIPNKIAAISGLSITGSIKFTGQIDRYTYKAPKTGRYRFDFDSSNVKNYYYFFMADSKNNQLAEIASSNYGKNVDLESGQTYTINVSQASGLLDYTIRIGVPNDPQSITGNTFSGKLRFIKQTDNYTYVAPKTGKFTFTFKIGNSNGYYWFIVHDSRQATLAEIASSNGLKTISMTEGEKYSIVIMQASELTDYQVDISISG